MKPLYTIYYFDHQGQIPEDRASIIEAYSEQLQATPNAVGKIEVDREAAAQPTTTGWLPPLEQLYWSSHNWRGQHLITVFHFLLGAKIVAVQLEKERSYYLDRKHGILCESWLAQVLEELTTQTTDTKITN